MLSAPSPAGFILFGPFLKALRKQAGLSQEELGRAVNYTREYITLLERGKRNPDPTTVATLFVPALGLIDAPEAACRLIELAARARGRLTDASRSTTSYSVRAWSADTTSIWDQGLLATSRSKAPFSARSLSVWRWASC